MFRLPIALFLSIFLVGAVVASVKFFHIHESDIHYFQELEAKSQSSELIGREGASTFAQQIRQGVIKEFWLNRETAVQEGKVMQDFELESLKTGGDHSPKVKAPTVLSDYGSKDCVNLTSSTAVSQLNQHSYRQLIRILCKNSELFFFPEGKNVEVVEQMDQVDCLIQEEFYYLLPTGQEALTYPGHNNLLLRGQDPHLANSWIDPQKIRVKPMQKIRSLKASKACYNYTTNLFIADHVKMWSYEIPGHEPPLSIKGLKAHMESTADSVEFLLNEQDFTIKAHHLKAQFQSLKQNL
jgi:hypothetical protein